MDSRLVLRAVPKAICTLLLVGGAFAAWGLWLAEVLLIKGWGGLAWLSGFNWSALPICVLIVVVTGHIVNAHARWAEKMKFIGAGFVVTLVAFAITRWTCFQLFWGGLPDTTDRRPFVILIATWLGMSVALSLLASRWLAPLHRWTGILVALGLALAMPLSFLTIKVFPAVNGSTDQIHAIKMGYPVFWIALLLPLAMRLGRKSKS